jgi:hypothetical protein
LPSFGGRVARARIGLPFGDLLLDDTVVSHCLARTCLLVLFIARASFAEEGSSLVAQGLFDSGLALMDEGNFDQACPKFAESQRLSPAGGTLTNLALCHERQGRIASASVEYERALVQAVAEKRDERARFIRERLALIGDKVPGVIVSAPGSAKDALTLDESPLPSASLGVRIPCDPGTHTVRLVDAMGIAREQSFDLAPGETRTITFDKIATLPRSTLHDTPTSGPHPWQPALLWSALGLGAVAAATGAFALSSWSTYKNNCFPERDYCVDAAGNDAAATTRVLSITSTVALGLAIVALGTALILPRSDGKRSP